MSGSMFGIVELLLFCGVVFGWGFYELRSLRKYRDNNEAEKPRQSEPDQ